VSAVLRRIVRNLDGWAHGRRVPLYGRARAALRRLLLAAVPPELVDRVRARLDDPYREYIRATALDAAAIGAVREDLAGWPRRPRLSVVMTTYNSRLDFLAAALASVRGQLYADWELCVADDASTDPAVRRVLEAEAARDARVRVLFRSENGHISRATNSALSLVTGEFVLFLDHDDLLAPDALYEVARALVERPDADIVYSDDDKVDERGRRFGPQFKPDWSPDLLLSYCYVGHLKAFRASLVRDLGGMRPGFEGSQDYDLLLRATERTERVVHVPRVLYHWRVSRGSTAASGDEKPYAFEAGRRALQEALSRRGLTGHVERPAFAAARGLGVFEVRLAPPPRPVSIVIPFKDRLDLLATCLGSIERLTSHPYEVVLVDNGSGDPAMLDYLRRTRHTVVRCPTPDGFNFSRVVNAGVETAAHDLVLLLNNDTEVIAPEWLGEMVAHVTRPGVGAVGAKLLFGDGRVQHAGVVVGPRGLACPAFKLARHGVDHGYLSYADVLRNYAAVTAACLLTPRGVYRAVGGFDETHLAVAYNDVDYCLRLVGRGLRVVYAPRALLYHREAATRGPGDNPAEERHFRQRWARYIDDDPFYNPNLGLADEQFRIGRPRGRAARPRRTAGALLHA
jgi:GT2 family glycosyltransferase